MIRIRPIQTFQSRRKTNHPPSPPSLRLSCTNLLTVSSPLPSSPLISFSLLLSSHSGLSSLSGSSPLICRSPYFVRQSKLHNDAFLPSPIPMLSFSVASPFPPPHTVLFPYLLCSLLSGFIFCFLSCLTLCPGVPWRIGFCPALRLSAASHPVFAYRPTRHLLPSR